MPQPLSRVMPKASILVANAGARYLAQRAPLAVLAIEAIGSWANVESFLLRLFVILLGGNAALAAKVYLALDGRNAKSSALNAAVEAVADPKVRGAIKAVISLSKTNEKHRNKLVHHNWGISPDLPDALLLVDPMDRLDGDTNYDEVFVYVERDFREIIDANDRLCGYGLTLRHILKNHVANAGGRLLDELCAQPEIRERLDRQA